MDIVIILVLLVVLLGIWVVLTQRKLVVLDENINNAMSQIGVQISSRFDALIALLSFVEEYAALDTALWIEKVKSNRKDIHAKSKPDEVLQQEHIIAEALKFIVDATEQHSEIKGIKNYAKRMAAVDTYERMLRTSHLIYNDSVAKFNKYVCMFPTKWLARVLGFRERDYIEML